MRTQALIGTNCGKWEVLSAAPKRGTLRYYLCRCTCGKISEVREYVLTHATEKTACRSCAATGIGATHGMTDSFEFRVWTAMKKRCHYEKHPHYALYGGRGIYVCDTWRNEFAKFLLDMGTCPFGDDGSIDRIDLNKGYSLDNCRWILKANQAKHRRTVPLFEGETLPDLAAKLGIKYTTLRRRIAAGWPREKWGCTPVELGTRKE